MSGTASLSSAKPSRPRIVVEEVTSSDLPRCSEVFLLAFENDPVMRLVRPARLHQASLSQADRLENYAAGLKQDFFDKESKIMLKAVEQDSQKILGVAIWGKPGYPVLESSSEEGGVHQDDHFVDPEEDQAALKRLIDEMYGKRARRMHNRPHWYLTFLVVDPAAQGKGVGSALLNWGFKQADAPEAVYEVKGGETVKGRVPCVLEASTVGIPVYERHGFSKVDTCSIWDVDPETGKNIEGTEYTWPVMVREVKEGQ